MKRLRSFWKSLRQTRWGFQKITAIVFLIFIAFVFVFWGITRPISVGLDGGQVAVVNGRSISFWEFQREYQRWENQWGSSLRQNLGSSQAREFLTQQALNQLIQKTLMAQYVKNYWNVYVSDKELVDYIRSELDFFKENGQFNKSKYEALLQANQISPRDFENQVREDLQWQRFLTLSQGFLGVSEPEKRFYQKVQATQKRFSWVVLGELKKSLNWESQEYQDKIKEIQTWVQDNDYKRLDQFWQKIQQFIKISEWKTVLDKHLIVQPYSVELARIWNLDAKKSYALVEMGDNESDWVLVKLAEVSHQWVELPADWETKRKFQKVNTWLQNQIETFRAQSHIQADFGSLLKR